MFGLTVRFAFLTLIILFAPVSPAQKPPGSAVRFEDRQPQSAVRFVLNNSTTDDKPMIDSPLGGVALFDYDSDGYLDIFFTNGAKLPSLVKDSPAFHNRLYHNNRDGTFTDVTERAGVAGEGYSMGAAAADYDNDGKPDLYVTGYNRNFLYHNNGDGTFADVTARAGVDGTKNGRKLWSVAAAWIDYDHDGKLDLFVSNYLDWSFANSKVCGQPGKRLSCPPSLWQGTPDTLYHNNGNGTFTDVSDTTGIGQHIGKGMGVAIADYDGDGWEDIFVSNDNDRNFLFKNLAGKRFAEVGVEAAVGYTEDGIPVSSMGADFRDMNNDGRPDVVVTALGGETFPAFLNDGGGFFSAATYRLGLGFATSKMSGWSLGIFDFDNDGWKDLFTANSHVNENAGINKQQSYRQNCAIFQNHGGTSFTDVTAGGGPAMQVKAAHRGSAFGDLDNDGRVDVVVSVIGGPARLLYNVSPLLNHWIAIEVTGRKSNRDGIGTKIKLTGQSGLVQYNHVTTSVGYASTSERRVHFGLGADTMVREIQLTWPGGKRQVLQNIKADQILKVTEE